jgi:hypothetical protein
VPDFASFGYNGNQVRILRQFGALVLLLASSLAPAMACMIPAAQMTAEERACCRMMQNECGQMEMPASQGCCQKTAPNIYDTALTGKAAVLDAVAVPVIWLTPSEFLNPIFSASGRVEPEDSSPPQSPPSTVSILRI